MASSLTIFDVVKTNYRLKMFRVSETVHHLSVLKQIKWLY